MIRIYFFGMAMPPIGRRVPDSFLYLKSNINVIMYYTFVFPTDPNEFDG